MVNKDTTTKSNNECDTLEASLNEVIKSVKDPMWHMLNYIVFKPNGEYTENYTDIDLKTREVLGTTDDCNIHIKHPVEK